MTDRYTYRVNWSAEDNEYVGRCAEFPSLSWLAPVPEEAFAGIRRLVTDSLADMRALSEPEAISRSDLQWKVYDSSTPGDAPRSRHTGG